MKRYGTLIAAAVALGLAGWDLVREGTEEASQLAIVSMTVGLILIGAWLAIEIHYLWQEGRGNEPRQVEYYDEEEG
jgi:hypothetical protein